jgi:hypothetical protein
VDVRPSPELFLHKGACGACSNKQDHKIYVKTRLNLTGYSTSAAAISIFSKSAAMNQMRSAGFTESCSACWVGNMLNTLTHCFFTCAFGSRASCAPNGQLTDCL